MKLMTKELEKQFAKIGKQEGVDDPIVVAHFFIPVGHGDWWTTEFDSETREFFGYVSIFQNDDRLIVIVSGDFGSNLSPLALSQWPKG